MPKPSTGKCIYVSWEYEPHPDTPDLVTEAIWVILNDGIVPHTSDEFDRNAPRDLNDRASVDSNQTKQP